MKAILMTEEFWASSQFSVARHYGGIKIGGHLYIIVNKEGKDLFECSHEAILAGRGKAIPPGEPADLIRQDFQSFYRKLGRNVFIEVLKKNPTLPDKELKKIYTDLVNATKKTERDNKAKQPTLFDTNNL